jgi:hypothetical protein
MAHDLMIAYAGHHVCTAIDLSLAAAAAMLNGHQNIKMFVNRSHVTQTQ